MRGLASATGMSNWHKEVDQKLRNALAEAIAEEGIKGINVGRRDCTAI